MSANPKVQAVLNAINNLFSDTSVPAAETLDGLREVSEMVQKLIANLEAEITPGF